MVKKLLVLMALITLSVGVLYYAQQAAPTGYVQPYSVVSQTPDGVFHWLKLDSNGNLTFSAAGGSPASSIGGYVQPFAPAALDPNGAWQYLNLDASGNLKTTGIGGVTSFSGDGTLLTNNLSTGGTTATVGNAPAYTVWSNLTGSSAAPGYNVPYVPQTISSSGPVADPGGPIVNLYNNASGALQFNLPDGVAGMERHYRNATGKTGVITIAVTTGNKIDLNGADGTVTTGTLVSGGSLGDEVWLVSDAAHHWYATVLKGVWTNN